MNLFSHSDTEGWSQRELRFAETENSISLWYYLLSSLEKDGGNARNKRFLGHKTFHCLISDTSYYYFKHIFLHFSLAVEVLFFCSVAESGKKDVLVE